jgi:hypothetical protein
VTGTSLPRGTREETHAGALPIAGQLKLASGPLRDALRIFINRIR